MDCFITKVLVVGNGEPKLEPSKWSNLVLLDTSEVQKLSLRVTAGTQLPKIRGVKLDMGSPEQVALLSASSNLEYLWAVSKDKELSKRSRAFVASLTALPNLKTLCLEWLDASQVMDVVQPM